MKNFAICTLSCSCEETYIPGSHHFYMLVIKSWVGPGSEAMKYMYVYIQVGVQHDCSGIPVGTSAFWSVKDLHLQLWQYMR